MRFTNKNNIPLSLAVWLAFDEYDFVPGINRISVTSLIRPTRQFILAGRIPVSEREYDVSDFIAARMGHAYHDAIERAWERGYRPALTKLGYPEAAIDAVRINPDPATVTEDVIPVYLEKRGERQMGKFTISGKFDMSIEGNLDDTKSTSVYGYMSGNKAGDYIKQGSIYKWIFPDIIHGAEININFIFPDWSRPQARQQPDKYPQSKIMSAKYSLMSMKDTEEYIGERVDEIEKFYRAPDNEIPYCTDEQLWRSPPKFKYYSDPNKTDGRSTRNFDTLAEANAFKAEKGKGIVLTEPGKVKACSYCPAFNNCLQKDLYDHDTD